MKNIIKKKKIETINTIAEASVILEYPKSIDLE